MERAEAQARMQEIQRIMERTTLYTVLPGVSGLIGGGVVLIGCAVSLAMLKSPDFGELRLLSRHTKIAFFVMWTMIGVVAIAQDIVLTARAARRQGVTPVGRPGKFAAFSITPSIFVALVLTLKILLETPAQYGYVVPIWMMCYGTGVYGAGMFSVRLPRLLGLAFLAMGALGLLFFSQYGVVLAALSFGLLHILFGLVVLRRAGRSKGE